MIILRIISSLILLFWGVIFILGGIMEYKKPWYPASLGILEIILGIMLCIFSIVYWFL